MRDYDGIAQELDYYGELIDGDYGAFILALTHLYNYNDMFSDSLCCTLEKEMEKQINHIRLNTKIVTKTEVITNSWDALEWRDKNFGEEADFKLL